LQNKSGLSPGPDTHRLRKFSSEKGSTSLDILLTLDLPRAMMSEDGETSDEPEDEGGGPCAFRSDPPCSPVWSVGMAGWWIVRGLYPQRIDQVGRKDGD
jgi:hypothetical protein